MPFCPKCGNPIVPTNRFCGNCGAAVVEISEPVVPAEPVIAVPAVQTYTVPAPSAKSKVLGFIGMGLAIGGLVFALLGLLYTSLGIIAVEGMGFAMSVAFGLFSLPLSIVGGVLCNRSTEMGNRSAACSVGSIMRVAGIIVSAVMLFFGIVSLAA